MLFPHKDEVLEIQLKETLCCTGSGAGAGAGGAATAAKFTLATEAPFMETEETDGVKV